MRWHLHDTAAEQLSSAGVHIKTHSSNNPHLIWAGRGESSLQRNQMFFIKTSGQVLRRCVAVKTSILSKNFIFFILT